MKTIWIVLSPVVLLRDGKPLATEEAFKDNTQPLPDGAFPFYLSKEDALRVACGNEGNVLGVDVIDPDGKVRA